MDTWRTYSLDEIIELGHEWIVYRGRDLRSGKIALVHLVAPDVPPEKAVLLAKDRRTRFVTTPDLRNLLVEFGESDGFYGVVTEYVADALKAAKESVPGSVLSEGAEPDSPSISETKPASSASEPGEFTRMFRTVSNSGEPRAAPNTERASGDSEPGEFTRMFRTLSGTQQPDSAAKFAPAVPEVDASPVPGGSPRSVQEPDEFSRFHKVPDFDSAMPLKIPVRKGKPASKDPLEDWLQTTPEPQRSGADRVSSGEKSIFDSPPPPQPAMQGSQAPSEFSGFISRSAPILIAPLSPSKGAPEIQIAKPEISPGSTPGKKSRRLYVMLILIAIAAVLLVIGALLLSGRAVPPPVNGSKAPVSRIEYPQCASGRRMTSSICGSGISEGT